MSNLIKSNRYIPASEIRKLDASAFWTAGAAAKEERPLPPGAPSDERVRAEKQAEQILEDARKAAEDLLRMASEEAEGMRAAAREEIESWWKARRAEDEAHLAQIRKEGYDAGWREGFAQGEEEAKNRYASLVEEAGALVREAHAVKEKIIAEAEPFLVELATAVARKIVGEHLAVDPAWTVSHVRTILKRRRERGLVTLLVAPSELSKIQDARGELMMALDSEADLAIVPDLSVDPGGCVVRTAFGSIDARIDTQLAELKAALMEVAAQPDEGAERS